MDKARIKREIKGILYAEHMGDVFRHLLPLCDLLSIEAPVWDDEYDTYRFKEDMDA